MDKGQMNHVYYPRLIKRIRAVLIDAVLVPFVALTSLVLGVSLGVESLPAKLALFIVPILILEPALVAWTGGTIGHHLNRIKIVKKDAVTHIGFPAAIVRFFIKFVLGWFSLISILTTRKHQAVHDLAAGSVVVHKDIHGLPEYEVLSERKPEEGGYRYPSVLRRVLVILLYVFLSTVSFSILSVLLLSRACIYTHRCALPDQVAALTLDVIWFLSFGTVIVLGWRGKLYGSRRQPAE